MNKQHIAALISAINAAQPYVPPIIFAGIAGNPALNALVAVANGLLACEVRPVAAAPDDGTSETPPAI